MALLELVVFTQLNWNIQLSAISAIYAMTCVLGGTWMSMLSLLNIRKPSFINHRRCKESLNLKISSEDAGQTDLEDINDNDDRDEILQNMIRMVRFQLGHKQQQK